MNTRIEPSEACSLLVLSCDKYNDLWGPFFTLLNRFWPDCPFPVYLGSESRKWTGKPAVQTLNSSTPSTDWTGLLRDYLLQIGTPYVLIVLDDYFLRRRVENSAILRCLVFAQSHDSVCVRLI